MPDKSTSPTPPPPPSAPPKRPRSGASSLSKTDSSHDTTPAAAASTASTPAGSDHAAGSSPAAWITAAVAGLVLAALLLVYFAFLVPAKNDRTNPGDSAGNLTSDEKKAVVAAGTSAANLLTFTRAHFDTDYARALAGTTGQLRSDVAGKKAVTLKAMTQGKFDLGAQVTHQALEGPAEGKQKGYLVLVTINGYRSTTKTQPVQQNLEVTVVDVKGKWLASDVRNIGSV